MSFSIPLSRLSFHLFCFISLFLSLTFTFSIYIFDFILTLFCHPQLFYLYMYFIMCFKTKLNHPPVSLSSGPLTTTQVTSTTPARPFTSSSSPATTRPLAPTSHPIGAINKGPDLRPITATVPVTRRPPRPPVQGPEPQVCESRVARGVQWPSTQRGETVDRPCPKGSLGGD